MDKLDSISTVLQLEMPGLFIHGTDDVIVLSLMAEQLYATTPELKRSCLGSGAGQFGLYKPGKELYLRAIATFGKATSTERLYPPISSVELTPL